MSRHIGYKILAAVVICLLLGMLAIATYFTQEQRRSILEQNERTLLNLTETTSQSVQTIMLAGYADIAQTLAINLKSIPGIADFRILHREGYEAFQQNETIDEVNRRIGDEEFVPRDDELTIEVVDKNSPQFQEALATLKTVFFYQKDAEGENYLTFLTPIENRTECQNCHGSDHQVRGVVKLTTTLDAVEAELQRTWIGLAVAVVVITLAIILVVGLLVRKITLSVLHVANEMDKIASGEGDLTVSLHARGEDEIAALSRGFNTFVKKIHDTMVQVSGSVASLRGVSGEVQAIAGRSTQAIGQQHRLTERVVSAVTELSATMEEVSASADSTLMEARQVDEVTQAGRQDVGETIESMHGLENKVRESHAAMAQLSGSMAQIEAILKMIQDVSEQTNLLALNASIEAARAGDQGRGFAVVADEVRSLAARTKQSTTDIRNFVAQLQQNSERAALLMDECLVHSRHSIEQADRSGESLERVREAAQRIVTMNSGIATAMIESARVTEEINEAVVSISQQANDATAEAQGTLSHSVELSTLAEQLEELVRQFKL